MWYSEVQRTRVVIHGNARVSKRWDRKWSVVVIIIVVGVLHQSLRTHRLNCQQRRRRTNASVSQGSDKHDIIIIGLDN